METVLSRKEYASTFNLSEIDWKELGLPLTGSLPAVEQPDPYKFTYYMRRGRRYYFKSSHTKMSMLLREMPVKLKYGQEICLKIN